MRIKGQRKSLFKKILATSGKIVDGRVDGGNRRVSRAIRRFGSHYERANNLHKRRRREFNSMGGFEIMVAIAYSVGWPQRTTKTILDIHNFRLFKFNLTLYILWTSNHC